MKSEDFADFLNFDELQVGATGADFKDVKYATIEAVQGTRALLQRKVHLLKNGLTTGVHKSKGHPNGDDVDFWVEGNPSPRYVVTAMLASGFRGIGVYANEKGYFSYHGGIQAQFKDWLCVEGQQPTSIFNSNLF